jgi:hypothetical protein
MTALGNEEIFAYGRFAPFPNLPAWFNMDVMRLARGGKQMTGAMPRLALKSGQRTSQLERLSRIWGIDKIS